MNKKQLAILSDAIQKYGVSPQLDMTMEECAELIQAINKVKRSGIVAYRITKPNVNMDIITVMAYNNLCSEIADVNIMLAQLESMLCKETVQISIDRKIERLAKRIDFDSDLFDKLNKLEDKICRIDKVYISGRISGIVKDAPELFQTAEDLLTMKGYDVVNPMKLPHKHAQTWEDYMREDIAALCQCNAIYMLKNWSDSRGATIERTIAIQLGLDIIYEEFFNQTV